MDGINQTIDFLAKGVSWVIILFCVASAIALTVGIIWFIREALFDPTKQRKPKR